MTIHSVVRAGTGIDDVNELNRSVLTDQYGTLEGPRQGLVAGVSVTTVLEMPWRAIKVVLPAVVPAVLANGWLGG